MDKYGRDVSNQFIKGAQEVEKIAVMFDAKVAVLKSNSPSCGCGQVYDGTFSGRLREGDGMTTTLLKEMGVAIFTEKNLKDFF